MDTQAEANDVDKDAGRRIQLDSELASEVLSAGAKHFKATSLTSAVDALCRKAVRDLESNSNGNGRPANHES